MRERDAILELWQSARGHDERTVLATVCEVKGSAYRRPGARMLLTAGGRTAGVISGGCLDGDLWDQARNVMESGNAKLLSYDSTSPGDIVWGLGLGCRGLVTILLEPVGNLEWLGDGHTVATIFQGPRLGTVEIDSSATEHPHIMDLPEGRALVETLQAPPPLWIFGAGADTIPVARQARELGWAVQIIDLRQKRSIQPGPFAARFVAPEDLGQLEISPRAACVVMTHHFLHDSAVLQFLLGTPAWYIGVLGPKGRTGDMLAALGKEGVLPTPAQLERLYAPVGLDIGAETPEEIALAILSEIRAVGAGRKGDSLRGRLGSIHHHHSRKAPVGRVGVVILAAGGSTRMGRAKQLLQFNGRSLLRRAVEAALASQCAPVAVVVGPEGDRMRAELNGLPARIVQNNRWSDGLSTSVQAGLSAIETDVEAIVFVPCDQPALDTSTLDTIRAAHETTGRPIVVSSYGGDWGAPMLIARRFWRELRELTGDRGAQRVAYAHIDEVESVPFPEGDFDIDTREDYEALLKSTRPALQTSP